MELRPLTLTDTEAWSQLIATAFNRTPTEAASVWHWLNTNRNLVAWGAWEGEILAAQYSCLLRTLYLPTQQSTHVVGISTNMAVHPAYRGRGLVKQVAEPVYAALRERGVLAGVGFSNAEGVKVDQHSQGYGYRVVGALSSHLILLSGHGHRVHEQGASTKWSATALLPAPTLALAQPVAMWPRCIESMPTSQSEKICFHNSVDNLHHRFAAHPFRQYRFWVLRSPDGAAQGVVVDRPTLLLGLTGSSLLAIYGQDGAEVLRHWAHAIRAKGVRFIRVLATPYATALQALDKLGLSFKLQPRKPHYLTVKPLQADCPKGLFDLTQWDCLGGEVL